MPENEPYGYDYNARCAACGGPTYVEDGRLLCERTRMPTTGGEGSAAARERARVVSALRSRSAAAERSTWAQAADFIERMTDA